MQNYEKTSYSELRQIKKMKRRTFIMKQNRIEHIPSVHLKGLHQNNRFDTAPAVSILLEILFLCCRECRDTQTGSTHRNKRYLIDLGSTWRIFTRQDSRHAG